MTICLVDAIRDLSEHFGIGVVEMMAAGLGVVSSTSVSASKGSAERTYNMCSATGQVAHDSAGPKEDIVVEFEGAETGRRAVDAASYAKCTFSTHSSESLGGFVRPEIVVNAENRMGWIRYGGAAGGRKSSRASCDQVRNLRCNIFTCMLCVLETCLATLFG